MEETSKYIEAVSGSLEVISDLSELMPDKTLKKFSKLKKLGKVASILGPAGAILEIAMSFMEPDAPDPIELAIDAAVEKISAKMDELHQESME